MGSNVSKLLALAPYCLDLPATNLRRSRGAQLLLRQMTWKMRFETIVPPKINDAPVKLRAHRIRRYAGFDQIPYRKPADHSDQ